MFYALALIALGFLIVVHEAGHYFVARWCAMRVERFSIGFGPGILKHKSPKTGTVFQLAPVPFGGFVEIRGMNIAEDVDPDDKEAYANRPAKLRFLTILAGPATNWLSAIVLALLLYGVYGVKSTEHWYAVDKLVPDSASAGMLQPGDRILAINDKPVYRINPDGSAGPAMHKVISASQGAPVKITVRQAGELKSFTITPKPRLDEKTKEPVLDDGKPIYAVGIALKDEYERERVGVGSTVVRALRYPVDQTVVIVTGLYEVITGAAKAELGGPVRIVNEFKAAFESGFVFGIELLMVLSVYLALINLFPLPALDGGRLVFLAYEMITRRRANPKIEATVHMVGVLALFVVMVLVTYKDIVRWATS